MHGRRQLRSWLTIQLQSQLQSQSGCTARSLQLADRLIHLSLLCKFAARSQLVGLSHVNKRQICICSLLSAACACANSQYSQKHLTVPVSAHSGPSGILGQVCHLLMPCNCVVMQGLQVGARSLVLQSHRAFVQGTSFRKVLAVLYKQAVEGHRATDSPCLPEGREIKSRCSTACNMYIHIIMMEYRSAGD